jgi:ketosteroid isomerase-like protein
VFDESCCYPSVRTRNPELDARSPGADTAPIADQPTASDVADSERLARRWFAAVERAALDELPDLMHDEIRLVSRVRPGTVVEGREDVSHFISEIVAISLYEVIPEVYAPIDDQRVAVEGRMRWMDDERVIRDDPVVWALEFRDNLLVRFLPARSVIEAEALLASER